MRVNITPHANPSYNCLDVLILTLASNWGLEHRLMFADAWRFGYCKAPDAATSLAFEDALDVKELVEKREIERALRNYHGLLIRRNALPDLEIARGFIESELCKGFPVAIGVDAFHCHWSNAYRKYHLEHYCLAVDYDAGARSLTVIDPYLTMDAVSFPLAAYAETLRDALSFRRAEQAPLPPDWAGLVGRAASEMLGGSGQPHKFEQMRDLAHDIEKHLDFQHEVVRHEDPYASLLVLYFKTLSFSRLNYAECLGYLASVSRQPRLLEAAARMKDVGNAIYKIFLLLMKMSMTPQRFKAADIGKRLVEIADREEALARELAAVARLAAPRPQQVEAS